MKTDEPVTLLQAEIGYTFKNKQLFELALTHSSYKNNLKSLFPEKKAYEDNERLEFLGDAILSFVISKTLYTSFRQRKEGVLSKYRSILVSKKSLFKIGKELKLHKYLFLGKSELESNLDDKSNILADSIESLIAAIFLDGGMKNAEQFILKYFGKYLDEKKLSRLDKNYKSALQEISQKKYKVLPHYNTVLKGEHFQSTVSVSKSKKASGEGKNKREAEQAAAQNLIRKLKEKKKK